MDIQLQELIDKIKKDGVASAESAANEIVANAEKKAASIIAEAQEKADSIMKASKAETERLEKASIDAIQQAGRNLLISFRDGVTSQLSALVTQQTTKAFNADMLKTLIPNVVKAWIANTETNDISVLLSEKDLNELGDSFNSLLKDSISKGLEIKADDSLQAGFKIGTKDGAAYYDFSSESVAELFASYLNPRTAKIMKDAAKQEGNA